MSEPTIKIKMSVKNKKLLVSSSYKLPIPNEPEWSEFKRFKLINIIKINDTGIVIDANGHQESKADLGKKYNTSENINTKIKRIDVSLISLYILLHLYAVSAHKFNSFE